MTDNCRKKKEKMLFLFSFFMFSIKLLKLLYFNKNITAMKTWKYERKVKRIDA